MLAVLPKKVGSLPDVADGSDTRSRLRVQQECGRWRRHFLRSKGKAMKPRKWLRRKMPVCGDNLQQKRAVITTVVA